MQSVDAYIQQLQDRGDMWREMYNDVLRYVLTNTPDDLLREGQARYEQAPKRMRRSDDSYSYWEDTIRWDELSDREKIRYIFPEKVR